MQGRWGRDFLCKGFFPHWPIKLFQHSTFSLEELAAEKKECLKIGAPQVGRGLVPIKYYTPKRGEKKWSGFITVFLSGLGLAMPSTGKYVGFDE